MGSDALVQSHQFGELLEHGLVLHHWVFEEAVQHHVAKHHLFSHEELVSTVLHFKSSFQEGKDSTAGFHVVTLHFLRHVGFLILIPETSVLLVEEPHVIMHDFIKTITDVINSEHFHVGLAMETIFSGQVSGDGHGFGHLVLAIDLQDWNAHAGHITFVFFPLRELEPFVLELNTSIVEDHAEDLGASAAIEVVQSIGRHDDRFEDSVFGEGVFTSWPS